MKLWRTNMRSGRAHRVINRKPECGAPTPQGGVTWVRTTRGHVRCADCLALDNGATVEDLNREHAHGEAIAENTYRAYNN